MYSSNSVLISEASVLCNNKHLCVSLCDGTGEVKLGLQRTEYCLQTKEFKRI